MKDRPQTSQRVTTPARGLVQRFAYAGLIVAAFALMLLGKADAVLMERFRTQVTDAVAPILDVISRPVATIADAIDEARGFADLKGENDRLREDRAQLLRWQAAARRLEAENQALRSLLKFVPGPEARYISARVIADTGGAFAHSLLLNTGSHVGVRKGEAVVTGEGLIGRVAEVGARSIRVLLITDLNSRIPVVVEPNRTRAILAGNNSDRPRLIHLPPGSRVSPGDRVVTSGHAGAFPPGLPVGVVASVSDGGIGVQPFVKRERIEYVRVVDYGLRGILPAGGSAAEEGGKAGP